MTAVVTIIIIFLINIYHHFHSEPKSYLCINTDLPLRFVFFSKGLTDAAAAAAVVVS